MYAQCGRRSDALRAYEEAIRAKPDLALPYYNLAALLIDLGRCDEALAAAETAVRLAPDFYHAHAQLSQAYRHGGRDREALVPALRAAELRPDRDAYLNLGFAAFGLDEFDLAIDANRRALALDAACPEAYSNLGWLYHLTGRDDEAIAACTAAIALRPDFAAAHDNLGVVYQSVGRHAEAVASGEAAVAVQPDFALAHCNLGAAYHSAGRDAEALAACQAAIALQPNFAAAHCNLGAVYHSTGRYAEAIAAFTEAIAQQPDFASAHFNRGLSLLVRGDFARGWEEYVWTQRVPAARARFPYLDRVPLWNGEPFAGRRLLVTSDQGFGDAIQFARYLPAVKALGGSVILEAQAALVPLFADLRGVDELRFHTGRADLADLVDLQIPLSGLPRAFGTDLASIPTQMPYLRALPERVERWRPRLRARARVRVGIVWAGNCDYPDDRRRSVPLDDFAVLGETADIAWFGLQKGRDEDRRSSAPLMLDPLGSEIIDFADTAAIIAQLDLVIGVDTSVVHLAGALGKPAWTLLPFVPDWRWLLERGDSPWYPSMRLFRQPAAGDWAAVFGEIARELRAFRPSEAICHAMMRR